MHWPAFCGLRKINCIVATAEDTRRSVGCVYRKPKPAHIDEDEVLGTYKDIANVSGVSAWLGSGYLDSEFVQICAYVNSTSSQ
jgi:hypothetical protein